MDWTQSETASFLGLSRKAIESYEQGWRNVPDAVWKELLTLAAVQRGYPTGYKPCRRVMGCSAEIRHTCFCSRKMGGFFCWMTAATNCRRNHPELKRGLLTCVTCPVVRQFL
jgi:hypothetical protein